MFWRRIAICLPSAFSLCTITALTPELAAAQAQKDLSLEQIVQRMQQHEANQSQELKHYEAVREYQVQYKGFGTHIAAKMEVNLEYDRTTGKTFRIISQSGSKLLCDKVLKRAVESEEEASKDKASTALNATNYRFELIGSDSLAGRLTYILKVDPLRKNKFLYRGRVWVDADEFAVVKIEVEPAQNPSFWITSTQIENTNSKTDGIWLPERNRSESKIRVGGTAILTIDYGKYHVSLTGPVQAQNGSVSTKPPAKEAAF